MRSFRLQAGNPDYAILATTMALVVIGVIFVYSSSFAIALAHYDNINHFFFRQIIAAALGLGALIFFMSIDYHRLRVFSPLFMLAAVVSLAAVLFVGSENYGARSWFEFGPFPFQPSEFAKLALIIYISAWLASYKRNLTSFSSGFMPFVFAVGVVAALIMMEPDTGTTSIIVGTTLALFFIAGGSVIHVLTLGATALVAGALLVLTEGYRADRLLAFTSAESDPDGVGFQTLQLLIALGSGGWEGLGLGVSRQKFFYIPGAHSDGVFAIIGEETGFIGAMIVIALFCYLIYRGFRVAMRAHDDFGSYLALGVTCWIAFQALVNLGGVTRSIPLTGIPLPFVSYGGSSLIMLMAGVGVLLSVSRYSKESVAERRPVRRPAALRHQQPAMTPEPTLSTRVNEGGTSPPGPLSLQGRGGGSEGM